MQVNDLVYDLLTNILNINEFLTVWTGKSENKAWALSVVQACVSYFLFFPSIHMEGMSLFQRFQVCDMPSFPTRGTNKTEGSLDA